MDNSKGLMGRMALVVDGHGVASVDIAVLARDGFEEAMIELKESVAALSHSSSINTEAFKEAVIELSNQGFSIGEIEALITHIKEQNRIEKLKEEVRELTEMIPALKETYVDDKPKKSLEEKYRDKHFSNSTWKTQKRPWPKHGTGRKRTKTNRNEVRKNNKKTHR